MTPYAVPPQTRPGVFFHPDSDALATDRAGRWWSPDSARTRAILNDTSLSVADKRAVLADWASDRRAVANRPSQRQLDDGTILHVDEILRALTSLDDTTFVHGNSTDRPPPYSARAYRQRTLRGILRKSFKGHWPDDDDDPPPCPAGATRPKGPPPRHHDVAALVAA